jgi:hypothetical protein
MSFCGNTGSIPAMTRRQLLERYTGSLSVLPEQAPSDSDMKNGLVPDAWVRDHVSSLITSGIIPSVPNPKELEGNPGGAPEAVDPLKTFVEKDQLLQVNLKKEYCFYETRYFAALDSFLSSIASTTLNGNRDQLIKSRLDLTRTLNEKLTLLTQITNEISKRRYQQSQGLQSDINSLNAKMGIRRKELLEQQDILSRETAAADLHKRMVDYTTEKNKANTNLLTLYGILNITAIAMIFYVSRT